MQYRKGQWKEGRKMKEGRKEGRKESRAIKKGAMEGRKEGKKERKKEGRKEGKESPSSSANIAPTQPCRQYITTMCAYVSYVCYLWL
jgi:hypothetical protein